MSHSKKKSMYSTAYGVPIGCEYRQDVIERPQVPEDVEFEYIPNPAAKEKNKKALLMKKRFYNTNPTIFIFTLLLIGINYSLYVIYKMI